MISVFVYPTRSDLSFSFSDVQYTCIFILWLSKTFDCIISYDLHNYDWLIYIIMHLMRSWNQNYARMFCFSKILNIRINLITYSFLKDCTRWRSIDIFCNNKAGTWWRWRSRWRFSNGIAKRLRVWRGNRLLVHTLSLSNS